MLKHTTHEDWEPIPPGMTLWEEFIKPYGITRTEISHATGIPLCRLTEIFSGRRGISADTAIRIGAFLGLEPEGFLNMQMVYEQFMARRAMRKKSPMLHIHRCRKIPPVGNRTNGVLQAMAPQPA